MSQRAVIPASRPPLVERTADAVTLWAHRLAVRLDWAPAEFGDSQVVDEEDPKALRAEWRRQARLWADYNSETLFALKAGALMLGLALVAALIAVSAF